MAIVALGLFYPFIRLLLISLQEYVIFRPQDVRYIGGEHYRELVRDPYFWRSIGSSVIWVLGSVVPQFLMGLGMALVLNQKFKGRGLARMIIVSPWVLSGVVTGIIWLWIFDGTIGVANDLLLKIGIIAVPIPFGIIPRSAFMMLCVANTWRGAPFFAITILAALQSINPELYESAAIDGAGSWKRFIRVTVPLILNTIIVSTLLRVIWTWNWIALIITMTEGGPIGATRTLAMYIYDTAYLDGNFGYAATLAIVLCLILAVFSLSYISLTRKTEQ